MLGAPEKSGQGPEGAGAHRPSDAASAPAGAASRPIPCLDDCGAEASPIKLVVMVGFHHKVGSQVEYIYPPIQEDKEGNLSAEFLK